MGVIKKNFYERICVVMVVSMNYIKIESCNLIYDCFMVDL